MTSNMVPLGTPLPAVTLPDLDGTPVALPGVRPDGVLLVFFSCNHCPYVRHVEEALGRLAAEFASAEFAVVAICSNDVSAYPADDAPGLRKQRDRAGWDFPYLVDADQSAARAFVAACTPDFFLYGRDGRLAYRGALDDSTPGNDKPVTGDLLRAAIAATLADRPAPEPHRPAMGCGIKWKPGNEPGSQPGNGLGSQRVGSARQHRSPK